MNRKKIEKKKTAVVMDKTIDQIFVVNKNSLKPFIEVFHFAPENVTQERLGDLIGFFKINDLSDDSAYIVNFLTSVVKKEFFINPRRPSIESFESALNKINLAFSELANQGNINWIGKVEGAICVVEKNCIHFSVCGDAKVLLFRRQMISEISEGLAAQDIEPHPLKTFVNVSSGKMENEDHMIITTSDMFHILSIQELKKEAQRLGYQKFCQFLRTALTNELELSGTILLNVFETEIPSIKNAPTPKMKAKLPEAGINAFSESTYKRKHELTEVNDAGSEMPNNNEYIDGKTGHIYIQGEYKHNGESGAIYSKWFLVKEDLRFFCRDSKVTAKKIGLSILSNLRLAAIKVFASLLSLAKTSYGKIQEKVSNLKKANESKKITPETERIEKSNVASIEFFSSRRETANTDPEISSPKPEENTEPEIPEFIKNKIIELRQSEQKSIKVEDEKNSSVIETAVPTEAKRINKYFWFEKLKKFFTPSFSSIFSQFKSMDTKGKVIGIASLLAIFLAPPLLSSIFEKEPAPQVLPAAEVREPTLREKLSAETNIFFDNALDNVPNGSNAIDIILWNNKKFLIFPGKILNADSSDTYSLPDSFGNITNATLMKELDLFLLLTDQGKIISFSPVSGSFKENNLALDHSKVAGIGTYLTYLYVINQATQSIERYPRAEGGFGQKTDWLKENFDLSQTSALAIDDNIYLIQKSGEITQFFRGKKSGFALEVTKIPTHPTSLDTAPENSFIYILDTDSGRIIEANKNGQIKRQFFNEALIGATKIRSDEKNNKVYIIGSNGLISMSL